MISVGTKVTVADNTGARIGRCIKLLGKVGNAAHLGDKIVIAIQSAVATRKKLRIRQHEVRTGIIIRHGRLQNRRDGIVFSFFDNAILLIDQRMNPLGTRIHGPVAYELRARKRMRILLLARCVV